MKLPSVSSFHLARAVRHLACGAVLCAWCVGAQAVELEQVVRFNIPPQSLSAALIEFSRQTTLQVVVGDAQVEDVASPGVTGSLSIGAALQQVLGASGLVYRSVGEKTIVVTRSGTAANHDSGRSKVALLPTSAETASVYSPAPASDDAGQHPVTLAEVIVTAQKRSQRLHDVPISIVALQSEELDRKAIRSLADLALAVPGLAIDDRGGAGNRSIFMRGVGNSQGNSSLVGVYLDEASVTTFPGSELDLRIYDLERVEVLRGPQGTLYGEGSMGGTLRLITKEPTPDVVSGKAEIAGSFMEDGAPSTEIRGAINLPLVEDKAAVRIAALVEEGGGWIDQPALGRKDINDQSLVNVQMSGLWQVTDDFKLRATAIVHRNDVGAQDIGEDADGNYTQVFARTTTPSGEFDYEFYNLVATYDFGPVRLLSTTGYVDASGRQVEQGYRLPLSGPPETTPLWDTITGGTTDTTAFSQELRLNSTGNGPLNWTLGAFYRDAERTSEAVFAYGVPGDPLIGPIASLSSGSSESWAVFGDVSYQLTRRLQVGTGVRYFEDRRDSVNLLTHFVQTGDFDTVNPRFYAGFDVTPEVRVYASAAKGFRSGGFNGAGLAAGQPPYDPDKIWSYELGTKMSLLEGRMTAEIALFDSDYDNIQVLSVNLVNGLLRQFITNSGSASIRGVDWQLTARATENFTFGLGGEVVDTKYTEISAVSATSRVGDPLEMIPEYQLGAWASYDVQWAQALPGFVRIDYNRQGASFYRNEMAGSWFNSESDIIDSLNLLIGVRRDAWSAEVFGRNLLDERGFMNPLWIQQLAPRARPRTFGVRASWSF